MPRKPRGNGTPPVPKLGPDQKRSHGFQPGVSGNPGGMKKSVKILRDLIAERTDEGLELIDFAIGVMRGQVKGMEAATAREYAHQWLSDRYFGRPKQNVDITGQATPQQLAALVALQLSPHERRMRIAELKARAIDVPITTAPVETTNGHDVDGD